MTSSRSRKVMSKSTITTVERVIFSAASEGLDRSKWSKEEIEAFDSLTEEVQQLNKTRYKAYTANMGPNSRQRKLTTADLGWPDDDFKFDPDTANYKYTGSSQCLLRTPHISCDHDLCHRATIGDGISYLEHDTVSYYDKRIASAKGQRMKDALRKQRDGQLVKDKDYMEDWRQRVSNKVKSFGKEAYESLLSAAYGTNWASQTTPVPPFENPIVLVGRRLSILRILLLDLRRHQCGESVARLVTNSSIDSSSWQDLTEYLKYFGPVKLCHIDAAVINIHEVLSLNATVYYEIDYCLRTFLHQFKHLLKRVPPSKKNSPEMTVNQALHYITQTIQSEYTSQGSNSMLDLASGNIYSILLDCSVLENRARAAIKDTCSSYVRSAVYPDSKLERIKEECVSTSVLPSVSEISLATEVWNGKLQCTLQVMIRKMATKPGTQTIQEALQQVRGLAKGRASSLLSVLSELRQTVSPRSPAATKCSISADEKAILQRVLTQFESMLEPEIEVHNQEAADSYSRAIQKAQAEYAREKVPFDNTIYQDFPGLQIGERRDSIFLLQTYLNKDNYGKAWVDLIKRNVWRGAIEAFTAFRYVKPCCELASIDEEVELIFRMSNRCDRFLLQNGPQSTVNYFKDKQRQGCCAPAAFARYVVVVAHISAMNPKLAKEKLQQLDSFVSQPIEIIDEDFMIPLTSLTHNMLSLYGFLVIELMHRLGRSDVDQVVLSVICLLMVHVLLAVSKNQAEAVIEYIIQFLRPLLNRNDSNASQPWEKTMMGLFSCIFKIEALRCCTPKACMEHAYSKERTSDALTAKRPEILRTESLVPMETRAIKMKAERLRWQAAQASRKYKSLDDRLLRSISRDMSMLDAGYALKYIVYRLKAVNEKCPDRAVVDKLSLAFQDVEHVLGKTAPEPQYAGASSLNIGVHNQCNIWELSESKEKAYHFFRGLSQGYRDRRDIDCLIRSLHDWAISSFSCLKSNSFTFLAERLIDLAGDHVPETFKSRLIAEAKVHEANLQTDEVALRCIASRSDYLLSLHSTHDKPTTDFLLEMSDGAGINNFLEYCENLMEEVAHRFGNSAEQEVRFAVKGLEQTHKSGARFQACDDNLKKISRYAVDCWKMHTHQDVVYFAWDHEEEPESSDDGDENESIDGNSSSDSTNGSCTSVLHLPRTDTVGVEVAHEAVDGELVADDALDPLGPQHVRTSNVKEDECPSLLSASSQSSSETLEEDQEKINPRNHNPDLREDNEILSDEDVGKEMKSEIPAKTARLLSSFERLADSWDEVDKNLRKLRALEGEFVERVENLEVKSRMNQFLQNLRE